MNILELRTYLDTVINSCTRPELITIEIVTAEPSWGPLPTVGIDNISKGFDWNDNKLLVFTDKPIIKKD